MIRVPVCPVSRVLEVTQTHIHIHTHTFTPWRVPRGGGLEGRHAHGELEAHSGAARSMVVASARTTAAEIAARWCARKVRGEDRVCPVCPGCPRSLGIFLYPDTCTLDCTGNGRVHRTSAQHGAPFCAIHFISSLVPAGCPKAPDTPCTSGR